MPDRCACPSEDPVACMSLRYGWPSEDYDGSPEQCSCACHDEYDCCPDCRDRWSDCECGVPR